MGARAAGADALDQRGEFYHAEVAHHASQSSTAGCAITPVAASDNHHLELPATVTAAARTIRITYIAIEFVDGMVSGCRYMQAIGR